MSSQLTTKPSTSLLIAAFATVYVVWGSTYLAIKLAVASLPPFLMAGTRHLTVGLLMYPVLAYRTKWKPSRSEWIAASVTGTLLLLGGNGLVSFAEQTVASSVTALIIATVPIWFVLLDWLVFAQRRPTPATVLGIILGTAGAWLLISTRHASGSAQEHATSLAGMLIVLLACLCWAVGSLYTKRKPQPTPLLQAVAMQKLAGGVAVLLVSLVTGELGRFNPAAVTTQSVLAWAYLVVFGSILGYSAFVYVVSVASPGAASTYAYVNPVVAVLLGWLFGEALHPQMFLAMAMILAAVATISLGRGKSAK